MNTQSPGRSLSRISNPEATSETELIESHSLDIYKGSCGSNSPQISANVCKDGAETITTGNSNQSYANLSEQPPDDLSTLMMKGATDLRNAKIALENKVARYQSLDVPLTKFLSQKNECRRLTLELEVFQKENNEIKSKIETIKRKTKDALEKSDRK